MRGDIAMTKAMREVQAHRISTIDPNKPPIEETCNVALEGPLTIDVNEVGTYTVLCTPTDKRAMAIGFLFSEGIITNLGDIALLNECMDDPSVIRVRLNDSAAAADAVGRNLLIVSSCGFCGSESMDEKLTAMPRVENTFRVEGSILRRVSQGMGENQVVFKQSGGTHGIGLFNTEGEIVSFAEDIGRHNALDKAIGKSILLGKTTAGLGAAMSGRVSLEMVGKCARAGIEVISAVSAPTSLALEAASRCNITVLAFVRDTRATVFSCPERVLDLKGHGQ